mmetsp:Transcript_9623/g.16371  ORF Transcript_9623/g.16371 Transcript_9623/m.16371 type:complete len:556 (-) Transcript_9623:11-1678(-)
MASYGTRGTTIFRSAFVRSFVGGGGRLTRRATHNNRSNTQHLFRSSSSFPLHLSSSTMRSSSSSTNSPEESANGVKEQREWSNYEKLVRKLYMTNLFNPVKLGLENMEKLHKAIGSPMDQPDISVIHIAGSNGKGSVALKTANTLRLADYKVGLFVSPHISSFRERIQINGEPLSEAQVEKYLKEIYDICEEQEIPATFFEVTTALAFRAFAQEGVEVVVLETGLGGRLDATNVIKHPALSIITSIGLEHTRILGDTVELIALEKGGIIKEGRPVLVGNNVPFETLKQCAEEKKASQIYQCEDLLGPEEEQIMIEGKETFEDYDAENSKISKAGLILLQFHLAEQTFDTDKTLKIILPDTIDAGVKIRPPCRFEEMDIKVDEKTVRVILDVAHNPQAIDYLIAKLRANYPTANQRIVVGMSADKDLKYCTNILLDYVSDPSKLHLVEASHPRAASISSILEANPKLSDSHYEVPQADDLNKDGRDVSSVSTQVQKALKLATENNEMLVVCGSVFIMADARETLGIVEPRDSAVIAEVAGAGMRNSQENFSDSKKN